jgi:flavin-dependent dehydrogenase
MKALPHVIVIGAGPAGTATALALLNANATVTLFDHTPFPRHRPGETLPPAIEPLLAKLHATSVPKQYATLRHDAHWVAWGQHTPVRVPFGDDANWHGAQVPRDRWDHAMLQLAIERGAAFVPQSPPEMALDRNRRLQFYDARFDANTFVVDCSGASRWLARRLDIAVRQVSRPLVAQYGYARGRMTDDVRAKLPMIRTEHDGWTWLAEVAPDRFHWTHVAPHHAHPPHDWHPAEFAGLTIEKRYGADVTWRTLDETAGRRWFVAGDAAAILDPSSGHGMLRAMMSGMMAAHLILATASEHMPESNAATFYQNWLADWFAHDANAMRQNYLDGGLFDPLITPAAQPRVRDDHRGRVNLGARTATY